MPGKGATATGSSAGGFTSKSKNRMSKRDFEKSEWTLVAEKGELGDEIGSTKAVEAGMSPMGQNYVWTLFRGEEGAGAIADGYSNVYATDGSCVSCTSPNFNSKLEKQDGEYVMNCGACGSVFSMETGAVLKWLPGEGPVQWMAQQMNAKKEEQPTNVLKTRVSQSGRVYVRLPDGTLPMAKSAADRAAEAAELNPFGETPPQSAKEQVMAAQKKAASSS